MVAAAASVLHHAVDFKALVQLSLPPVGLLLLVLALLLVVGCVMETTAALLLARRR